MNKCARCGCDIGFDSEWSEEDAKEEYQKMFPNDPNMEVATDVICDDCYEEFKKWHSTLSPEIKEEYDKEMMETR